MNFINLSFLVSALSLISISAHTSSDKTLLLKAKPTEALVNEVITLEPIDQHHFNLKAPNSCGNVLPIEKTAKKIQCQISSPGKHQTKVYVCDDKKSFCRPEVFDLTIHGNSKISTIKASPAKSKPSSHHGSTGFLQNQFSKAIKQAKSQNKLIFIDFFGIWCPPCQYLEEYVFEKHEFINATKDMIKIQVDVDSKEAQNWIEHFKIRGYPTLVIANSKLEEIGRTSAPNRLEKVLTWINGVKPWKSEPLEQILKLKKPSNAQKKRLALWYSDTGFYEKAIPLLSELTDLESRQYKIYAEKELANKNGDKPNVINHIKAYIQEFSDDLDTVWWLFDLFDESPEDAKKLAPLVLKTISKWHMATDTELAKKGFFRADLYQSEASVLEEMGDKGKAKDSYLKAASAYEELAKASPLKTARVAHSKRAQCLLGADKNLEAKEIYARLAKSYSDEYTFNFGYARVLKNLKEFSAADPYAEKALQHSYGNNQIRAIGLKAEIESELGNKPAAVARINQALSSISLPKFSGAGAHWRVKELRNLLTKIEKAQTAH